MNQSQTCNPSNGVVVTEDQIVKVILDYRELKAAYATRDPISKEKKNWVHYLRKNRYLQETK